MEIAPPQAVPQDPRWKLVEATMRRHGYAGDALIETLHTVQETYGCLDEPVLFRVARSLLVPPSRVYGVATFYHFFSLRPSGRHACVLCTGTACYTRGADRIREAVEKRYGIALGQTTPDGEISLLSARCLGSCGLAPAAVFDGEIAGKLTPEQVIAKVEACVRAAVKEGAKS